MAILKLYQLLTLARPPLTPLTFKRYVLASIVSANLFTLARRGIKKTNKKNGLTAVDDRSIIFKYPEKSGDHENGYQTKDP